MIKWISDNLKYLGILLVIFIILMFYLQILEIISYKKIDYIGIYIPIYKRYFKEITLILILLSLDLLIIFSFSFLNILNTLHYRFINIYKIFEKVVMAKYVISFFIIGCLKYYYSYKLYIYYHNSFFKIHTFPLIMILFYNIIIIVSEYIHKLYKNKCKDI